MIMLLLIGALAAWLLTRRDERQQRVARFSVAAAPNAPVNLDLNSLVISPDGKTARLDDPKVGEALSTGLSLIGAQGGWGNFKAFRDTWDFFGRNNQVAADQVGAWPMESFYYNVLAEGAPARSRPPSGRAGHARAGMPGHRPGWPTASMSSVSTSVTDRRCASWCSRRRSASRSRTCSRHRAA